MVRADEDILAKIAAQLTDAKQHLEYSVRKIQAFNLDSPFTEEQLETLESFSSRFARFSDLVIRHYFRALALQKDPAWRGSVIDTLNLAEKEGWIESATEWRRIRELRNCTAHEYSPEDVRNIYKELRDFSGHLLDLRLDLGKTK